ILLLNGGAKFERGKSLCLPYRGGMHCAMLSGSAEPGGQGVSEPRLSEVSGPGHISIRPDQHGFGTRDRSDHWKLPRTNVRGVDQLNPICPWSNRDAVPRFAEVEQHRPGIVQQSIDAQGAGVGGDQIEIGHAAAEQRVTLAEVVM